MITFWTKLEHGRHIRQNIRFDVNRCCGDDKQVLTPSEWLHGLHCTNYGNFTLVWRFRLQIWYKYTGIKEFYSNSFSFTRQYFQQSTNKDTFVRPCVHCALQQSNLFAMTTPLPKAFTTDVGKCSSGGIIWPSAVFSSVVRIWYLLFSKKCRHSRQWLLLPSLRNSINDWQSMVNYRRSSSSSFHFAQIKHKTNTAAQ